MKELNTSEIELVSGGLAPAIIVVVASGLGSAAGRKAAEWVKSLF